MPFCHVQHENISVDMLCRLPFLVSRMDAACHIQIIVTNWLAVRSAVWVQLYSFSLLERTTLNIAEGEPHFKNSFTSYYTTTMPTSQVFIDSFDSKRIDASAWEDVQV